MHQREIVEQPVRVGGDPEHPLLERHAQHRVTAALAAAVDDLLVGEHRAELRAPVDGLLAQIGQAMAIEVDLPLLRRARRPRLRSIRGVDDAVLGGEDRLEFGDRPGPAELRIEPRPVRLEPDPLGEPVVGRIGGGELPGPVVAESETLELSSEGVDRLAGGLLRMHPGGDRVLLRGQAECVPAHRMQDVETLHPLVSTEDVGGGVALRMADVQAGARGVGEHVEAVELRLRGVEPRVAGVGLREGVLGVDPRLPSLLDLVGERAGVAVRQVVGRFFGHGRLGGVRGGTCCTRLRRNRVPISAPMPRPRPRRDRPSVVRWRSSPRSA